LAAFGRRHGSLTEADVVFLHGYACTAADWAEVACLLPGSECLLVDFPAHGLDAGAERVGFADLCDGAKELLGRLRRPPALAGHSMGGMVAMAVAADSPGLVGALILADAFPCLPVAEQVLGGPEDPADPFGYGSVMDRETPVEVQIRVRETMGTGVELAGLALHRELAGLDLRPLLGRVRVPVLAVTGDRHRAWEGCATRLSERLGLAAIPSLQAATVPSHHFVMLERPGEVAALIGDFLERHGNRGSGPMSHIASQRGGQAAGHRARQGLAEEAVPAGEED
jgi:pimeloyl-ACP methyl ester carboxylesterase